MTADSRSAPHATVVPATPGWFALEPTHDAEGLPQGFTRQPVIAWLVEVETIRDAPYPITYPVCVRHVDPDAPVLQPDGRVVTPLADFESEIEALCYCRE